MFRSGEDRARRPRSPPTARGKPRMTMSRTARAGKGTTALRAPANRLLQMLLAKCNLNQLNIIVANKF